MFAEIKAEAQEKELWQFDLLKAADILEQQGLAKYLAYDEHTGAVCFIGALCWAITGKEPEGRFKTDEDLKRGEDVYYQMRKFLDKDPIDWNNDCNSTKDEIVQTMRKCAFG